MTDQRFYATEGGALPLNAQTYVERPVDQRLYEVLRSSARGDRVCAILAPRQMGKSSLMVRVAHRLTAEELATCVKINLQKFGDVRSDADLWFNLLRLVCQELNDDTLLTGLDQFWQHQRQIQPALRFEEFLKDKILARLSSKLVIFLDEIQTLIHWGLQDSLIGFLRALAQEQQPWLEKVAFVLIGVAKPSDLLSSGVTAWNVGTAMELTGLTGDCEPLLEGLSRVGPDPKSLMAEILAWTGGQPFLTQWLCALVAKETSWAGDSPADLVERVVTRDLITNWRQHDLLNHLKEIDNSFQRPRNDESGSLSKLRIFSLNLYQDLLNQKTVEFRGTDSQWYLLTSGLGIKQGDKLYITNRIYQAVFDETWVTTKKEQLQQEGIPMPDLNTVLDRDVFMLIDQSGSLLRKDGSERSRWEKLQEQVFGDIHTVKQYSERGQKICDRILMLFYNVNRFRGQMFEISDPNQAEAPFEENSPKGNAYVTPTLCWCFEKWLAGREKVTANEVLSGSAKGAMFVIYIDGQFDDSLAFEALVQEMCKKIDDQRIFKIIILGFGNEVNARYFDEIDVNKRRDRPIFEDVNGNACNVVVFELVDEMEDEGVVEVMERQLLNPDTVRKGFRQY